MTLVRPRLTDCYGILLTQEEVDFVIPVFDEDLPFFVDPFLLWKSPSQQDNSLHTQLLSVFNTLGQKYIHGDQKSVDVLRILSECDEAGLGFSGSRKGKRISENVAKEILELFADFPSIRANGIEHIEIIQLFVSGISKDRISDITCSILKSFLVDYTIEQCTKHGIPLTDIEISQLYDNRTMTVVSEKVKLPVNPITNSPIILIPKRWLRRNTWISDEDYFFDYLSRKTQIAIENHLDKGEIVLFNRRNYDIVSSYITEKEKSAPTCTNDPLFTPIPVLSAKRKLSAIKKLPTGKEGKADKIYENLISQLFASLLFPFLDYATFQDRIDSGSQIRDIIFYNNRTFDFLSDIYKLYESRQIVMEIKNVEQVQGENINQLNRYLSDEFGRFGILITRNELNRPMFRNTIDLWSGQRKCIISLSDNDIEQMVSVYESKQRHSIEIIKKKYIEFTRACPG